MDQLRKILKAARIEQAKTVDELAATLEILVQTILDFETGGHIEADVLFGLVNLLNVSPDLVVPHLGQIGWDITDETTIEQLVSKSR